MAFWMELPDFKALLLNWPMHQEREIVAVRYKAARVCRRFKGNQEGAFVYEDGGELEPYAWSHIALATMFENAKVPENI